MNDRQMLVFGITIALAMAGFYLSLFTTTHNAAYWWDEAEYSVLAKGLSSDSGFFGFYGDRSYRPPFLPVYISIFKSFISDYAYTLLIPIFSALSIAVVFTIGRKLFDEKAGIIAAGLMTFSTLYIFYSGRMLTEIPGILFSALSLFYYHQAFETGRKRDFILLALFTVCAFLVFYRFLGVIAAMGIYALLFKLKKVVANIKMVLITGVLMLVLLFPLFLYSQQTFGSFYGLFTTSYFGQEAQPLEYFLTIISHIFSNIFVVVLLILAILHGLFYGKSEQKYVVGMSLMIFITASILLNHKEDRYLMPLFPFAFLFIGAFASKMLDGAWDAIKGFGSSGGPKLEISAIKLFVTGIVLIMLYSATFGNISGAFELFDAKKASFGDVKDAALYLKMLSSPTDVILTDSVTAMFYADRRPYGFTGSNMTIFFDYLDKYHPRYILMTAYESGNAYINGLNNIKNVKTPTTSIEYILLHPERFQILKAFPSDTSPYVLVVKIIG